ncbi:hypothetical protein HO590_10760 [Streptococcus suis]|nr:hypothetical protein [Streptococcus suis]
MIDKTKQIVLVSVASLALLAFVSTMGYSLGKQSVTNEIRAAIKQEAKKLQEEQAKKEKSSRLSQLGVEAFLRHYFTKKQLGENNKRIKPYLTDSAYREELTRQEDTLQQVYKDYMSFNNFINYVYNTPPVAQTPQYQTLNLIKIASEEIDK